MASLDDGIAGFATGYREQDDEREIFYLRPLCVRPGVQGTGVGTRLMGHFKEHLGKSGVNTIHLVTNEGKPAEDPYRKTVTG